MVGYQHFKNLSLTVFGGHNGKTLQCTWEIPDYAQTAFYKQTAIDVTCVSCISLQDNFSKLLSVILQLSFQQPQACNCNPRCRHNLDFCGYGVFAVRLQLSLIACPEAVCLTPRFLIVSPLVSFILF